MNYPEKLNLGSTRQHDDTRLYPVSGDNVHTYSGKEASDLIEEFYNDEHAQSMQQFLLNQ